MPQEPATDKRTVTIHVELADDEEALVTFLALGYGNVTRCHIPVRASKRSWPEQLPVPSLAQEAHAAPTLLAFRVVKLQPIGRRGLGLRPDEAVLSVTPTEWTGTYAIARALGHHAVDGASRRAQKAAVPRGYAEWRRVGESS